MLLMVGSASAYIAWAPASVDPNVGTANWNVAANWDLGYVPVTADEVRFVNSLIPCLIDSGTDAVCFQVKVGDNGANDIQHVLTIKGDLTTSTTNDWSAAGYNRSGTINVERRGSFISGYRLGIGHVATANTTGAPSYLNVNGGDVTLGGNLQIGTAGTPGHKGIVNVNSGTLQAAGWEWRDTTGLRSFMDIKHGTVVINGNVTAAIPGLITAHALTGFGGAGTVNYAYANGKTTLTATDPLTRSPKMDAVVPVGDVVLSWKNVGTSPVYVAVYFDNGLGLDNLTRLNDPNVSPNKITSTVNAPSNGDYIWRVDTYDNLPGIDPNDPIVGDTMYFFASDDAIPTVAMDTAPMATWIDEPTPLQVTVKDDGKSAVTVTWTADDPNVVFTPATTVIPAQADYTVTGIAASTSMTCDYQAGLVTVTATVSDSNPLGGTNSASVTVFVASTACAASRAADGMNLAIVYPGDIVPDCMHNLTDFAELASEWQLDYTITEPEPDNR
jgi:hypothetical protein